MRSPSPTTVQERLRQIRRRRDFEQARELARFNRIRDCWLASAAPPFTAATNSAGRAAVAGAAAVAAAAAALPCVPGATAAVAVAAATPVSAESTASHSGAPAAATAADTTLSVAATAATAAAAPAPAKFARNLASFDGVIDLESDTECIDLCSPVADTFFDDEVEHYQRADRADEADLWRV